MSKKNICRVVAIVIALVVAGVFMVCDFGLGVSSLTKFFIVFFGGIVGLQCVPAAFLFIGIVKGVFSGGKSTVNSNSLLTRSGVKL